MKVREVDMISEKLIVFTFDIKLNLHNSLWVSSSGQRITAQVVHDHMKEKYDTYSFNGSVSSVRKILKEMGFKWSKEDSIA